MKVMSFVPGRVRFREESIQKSNEMAQLVEFYMKDLAGVKNCRANPVTGSIIIDYDIDEIGVQILRRKINMLVTTDSAYIEYIKETYKEYLKAEDKLRRAKKKMVILGGIYIAFKIKQYLFGKFPLSRSLPVLQLAAAITIIKGYPKAKRAYKKITRYFPSNEDKLLLLTGMAFTFMREGSNGTMLLFLKSFTDAIQSYTEVENRRLLLQNSKNPLGLMWYNYSEKNHLIPLESLELGDMISFYENETIPMEGTIIEGEAYINQIYYTGQPEIRLFKKGDKVNEGMIVSSGDIKVRIDRLVDKTPKEDLDINHLQIRKSVTRYQERQFYIASAMALASYFITGTTLGPLAVYLTMCTSASKTALNAGLSNYLKLLKKHQIVLRNINTIENIVDASSIVFDKTGTLTKGRLRISDIEIFDDTYTKDEILEACAACEAVIRHPVAYSLNMANDMDTGKKVDKSLFLPSRGVISNYNGHNIIIGNKKLLEDEGIEISPDINHEEIRKQYYLPIYVAIDSKLISIIYMIEDIEPQARELIQELRIRGIEDISVISGDLQENVARLGEVLEIEQVHGNMSIEDKECFVINKKQSGTVIMVGDGVNDTLAMEKADVSLSYSNLASERAVLKSDCILAHNEMSNILDLLDLTKKSYKVINGNITFAQYYNYIFGVLVMLGYVNPFEAKSLNTLNSIIAVFGSSRIGRLK